MPEIKIALDVPVTTYLHHSYPLAVALTNPNTRLWVVERFTNLFSFSRIGGYPGMDYVDSLSIYNEILTVVPLGPEFFVRSRNATLLIREGIDGGFSAVVVMDEFYLPGTQSHNRHHFVHPTLIHGYRDDRSEYKCYRPNDRGILCAMTLPYHAVDIAFAAALDQENAGTSMHGRYHGYIMEFLRPTTMFSHPYPVDLDVIQRNISDYANSQVSPRQMFLRFGIENKDQTVDHFGLGKVKVRHVGHNTWSDLRLHIEQFGRGAALDFRLLHLFYEHKLGLEYRLQYLSDHVPKPGILTPILDQWQALVQSLSRARLLALRASLSPSQHRHSAQRLLLILEEVATKEKSLLHQTQEALA